jgi:3-oxoadipate enol-lactonase
MPYLSRAKQPKLHYFLDDFTDPWRDAGYLMLQHGLLKSARFGYAWVPYLSRNYRIIRPDLRGHGQSQNGDVPPDGDMLVEDVIDLLDSFEIERVHFCGESLGGIVGTLLAAKHPERVRSLSLVSAPTKLSEATKSAFSLEFSDWTTAIRTLGLGAWSAKMNDMRFPPDTNAGLLAWQAGEMGKQNLDAMTAFVDFASKVDTAPLLPLIEAPVLGLYAPENNISGGAIEILKNGIRNFTGITLPTRHHAAFNAIPAICARQVLAFVTAIDGITFQE